MKKLGRDILSAATTGMLVLAPIYLAILLLLKAMSSLAGLVRPLVHLLPEGFPAGTILELLLVLLICFIIGMAIRNRKGRALWERVENSLFSKIPGYEVIRSLTRQLAGQSEGEAWQPALAEIEDALVPAFIIEELEDGRLTVFVPSVPTALAGAIYILTADRVHRVKVGVAKAIQAVSRWGSGSRDLVAAMDTSPAIQSPGGA
jgi:uncharacterized membrane protein